MSATIEIGDLVKVLDIDNPRDEYVEAITDYEDCKLFCLSDGTWIVGEHNLVKYKVQGDERRRIQEELNKVY